MKPTQKQIDSEIAKLKKMKPRVRRTSAFGDNHHNAIDAQVEVLTSRLSEMAIYDRSDDGTGDELNEDKWRENVRESALEARRWMDGDEPHPPSHNWKELES